MQTTTLIFSEWDMIDTLIHFETDSMFARSQRLRHPNIRAMISLGMALM